MAKPGMSESDVEPEDAEQTADVEDNEKAEEICEVKQPITVIRKAIKPSTPISIVIQSLIKNLCGVYASDDKNGLKLYKLICDKLYEMALIDESYSMNEFEGMRNQYQRAFHHLLTSARGAEQAAVPIGPVWPNNDITNEWSHYYREFDEISYIAGGGFGSVFCVKHKLDGTEYAVKKIFIRSEGIKSVMNYLSEVKTFASLNHSNIVQYKAAWLELGATNTANGLVDDTEEVDCEYSYYQENDCSIKIEDKTKKCRLEDTYIYPDIVLDAEHSFYSDTKEDSSDFQVSFEKSCHISYSNSVNKKPRRTKRSSISEGGNAICTVEEIKNLRLEATKPHPKWATLYIQMALCQTTLKQWLETRNVAEHKAHNESALVPISKHRRSNTVMEILRQLLRGLQYIHFKGIVHHDIKPSNIFMQLENASLLVQLGDFGLACPLQSSQHSLAFGTKLYAAPEQLAGKCDSKSDMYSLGIVLLELTETFCTDMERVQSITELRKGHLSSDLLSQQPQLAHIISQLVVRYPTDRPDATTLLKRIDVNAVESELVRDLQIQIVEKDEEIDRLKELLKLAGVKSV